jgi:hypothetical protein
MAMKAKQHFLLWRLTHGVEGHKVHRPVFQEYWEAIRFLQNGQLVAAIVDLHSLFEHRSDTINLPMLVREVEKLGQSIASRADLDAAETSVAKVRLLRNAAIAHRTRKRSYNDVFTAAAVTPDELGELIDLAIWVSNELLEAIGKEPEGLNPYPVETYSRMFRDLARLLEA